MARSATEDPLKNFRFRVIAEGIVRAAFTEVTGVEANTEEVKYREGGANETEHKSPGLTTYGDITLKRGQIVNSTRGGDDDFYGWHSQVKKAQENGHELDFRKDITIQQFDHAFRMVRQWIIPNCWPKHFKPFSDMNGTSSENSIEEMTLSTEGLELDVDAL